MKANPISRFTRNLLLVTSLALQPLIAGAAPEEAPSQLLEKGVYAEETKGDIELAITLYQQLVAEANANQPLAAQAQFRIGQCHLKKNRQADARAAFEKLIHDFPNEKELVAKARQYLPGALHFGPAPWVDGERLQFDITLSTGVDIGAAEYRADLVQSGTRKVWRVGVRMIAGSESVSSVDADAESFAPIASHWKHSMLGEVSAVYRDGEVEIRRSASATPSTIPANSFVIDNEEAMHGMRRLPLQVGYKATLPIVTTLGGSSIPIDLEVLGMETVEVPAGKFDCFKVHLSVGQDFWFSADAHRYLVKFEAGPVTAKLVSIAQRKPGETVPFRDDELGISFAAPANWVIWKAKHGQPAKQVLIRTFDPEANTTDGGIRLFATDSLSAAARKSARAWAEEELQKETSVKVRPGSWKEYNVAGRTGVGCVADFTAGGKAQTQFLLHVLGPKNSELFVIASAPEKFDALKASFDSIIASYRTTK